MIYVAKRTTETVTFIGREKVKFNNCGQVWIRNEYLIKVSQETLYFRGKLLLVLFRTWISYFEGDI